MAGSILAGASFSRGCSRSCMISPGRSPGVRQRPSLTARERFKRLSNSLTFQGKEYDSKICCVSRSTLTPLSRISTWIRGRMSSRRSRSGGIRISNPLIRWYKSARNEPARTASARLRLVAQSMQQIVGAWITSDDHYGDVFMFELLRFRDDCGGTWQCDDDSRSHTENA